LTEKLSCRREALIIHVSVEIVRASEITTEYVY